jgi:Glycosyl transferase family 2
VKLVMTLLVRNEADTIEANLDYHLAQGVDHVIVTDHGSTDETGELLRRYESTGAVTVLRDEGDEHHQSVRVTRMARLSLTEHGADWVIHNDADEYWWPLSGSLQDVFGAIPPEYGQIEVQRRNFLPRPDGPEPFYSRLVYREPRSLNPSGRPLEPKVAHRPHPDVTVAPGNHWISGGDLRPVPVGELLEIFHFPMRSYDQFERKVIQIGTGYEKLDHRSPEVGRDQLKLLQVYRENGLPAYYDDVRLDDEALRQGLASGGIVLDRRLEMFMEDLVGAAGQADRPDGPATRTFVASALRAMLDAVTAHEALEQTRAELRATGDALAQARAEAASSARDLAWTRTAAGSVVNLGRAMGGGHLLRRSPRLRRIWPRVRDL